MGDLKEGQGVTTTVQGKNIAIFNVGGEYKAIDDSCPHAGGPLGQGWLDGDVVTCPYHGWKFSLSSGECSMIPGVCVNTYEVKVEG